MGLARQVTHFWSHAAWYDANNSTLHLMYYMLLKIKPMIIREIPDHATFREKCVNTGLVRQTWDMSLFGPM